MTTTRTAPAPAADTSSAIGWLHRRAGFGLHPGELEALADEGIDAAYAALVGSVDTQPDPWEGLALDPHSQAVRYPDPPGSADQSRSSGRLLSLLRRHGGQAAGRD